jgi:UDP-N-acetylglucosamine 1-carboxyvinyltransferase
VALSPQAFAGLDKRLAGTLDPCGRKDDMDSITVHGGKTLHGSIPVSGAKNSAIKLMAASILTDQPLLLTNMPRLADTKFLGRLLLQFGVDVIERDGLDGQETLFDARTITSTFAPYDLVRQMRASFNVLGPLLARTGQAKVSLPGGCTIGARPVDLHLDALTRLGAIIELEEGYVSAVAPDGLKGTEIEFPFVSVGATEHTLMAAVLAQGSTVLRRAAREPEIGDLARCLVMMGAKIEGIDTETLVIEGVTSLRGGQWSVIPDRIEMGSYAVAAAMAGGEVRLTRGRAQLIQSLTDRMVEAGVDIVPTEDGVIVKRDPGVRLQAVNVATEVYPGFATDLQAQFMALMTTADGVSVIHENIFENRFMHAPELMRLGAEISVHAGEAHVTGVERLKGAPVMATDLRASVSLVIAGLVAEGGTNIGRVYHLDRGFERLEEKLGACGADIRRVKGPPVEGPGDDH